MRSKHLLADTLAARDELAHIVVADRQLIP